MKKSEPTGQVLNDVESLRYKGLVKKAISIINSYFHSSLNLPIEELVGLKLKLGDLFIDISEYKEAGRLYTEALELSRNVCIDCELISEIHLCKLLVSQQDYKNAIDKLSLVEPGAKKHGSKYTLALMYAFLGKAFYHKYENERLETFIDDAFHYNERSLDLFEIINDTVGIADQKSNIGRIYIHKGDYKKASDYIVDALNRFESIGYLDQIATQLNNLALLCLINGSFGKAVSLLKEALGYRLRVGNYNGVANIYENIAHIYSEHLNDNDKAIESYKEAASLHHTSRQLVAGTYEQRQNYFSDVFNIQKRLLELLCSKYFSLKPNALKNILGERHFTKQRKKLINEIIHFSEQVKSYVLLEQLNTPSACFRYLSKKDKEKHEILKKEVDEIWKEILKNDDENSLKHLVEKRLNKEKELADFELTQYLKYSGASTTEPGKITNIDSLMPLIKETDVLISYFFSSDNIYCLEITGGGGGIHLHKLCSLDSFHTEMLKYNEIVNRGCVFTSTKIKEKSENMMRLLTKNNQLFNALDKIHTVFPDGEIHNISFEGFPFGEEKGKPAYLVDKIKISYCPSLSLFERMKQVNDAAAPEIEFVSFTKPVNSHIAEIKSADQYLEKSEVFDSTGKIIIKKGEKATINEFESIVDKPIRCMHILAHGYVPKPGTSSKLSAFEINEPALIFSTGKTGTEQFDYKVSDIFSKNTRIRLLTLSACSTGHGKIINGEGINSLSRAFLAAGVKCILASLWPVHADVSEMFMKDFYSRLHSETILDAFYKARQNIKKEYPDLYDWAPYILIGESQQYL